MHSALFFTIIIIIFIYWCFANLWSKWLVKENREKITDKKGRRIYYTGLVTIIIVFYGAYIFTDIGNWLFYPDVIFGLLFCLLFYGFQAMMAYKYIPTKQYRVSVLFFCISVLCVVGLFAFHFQSRYMTLQTAMMMQPGAADDIEQITIVKMNPKQDTITETVDINGQQIQKKLMSNLTHLDLKKTYLPVHKERYSYFIVTGDGEGDGISDVMTINLASTHVTINSSPYKILATKSNEQHIQKIESLMYDKALDWE